MLYAVATLASDIPVATDGNGANRWSLDFSPNMLIFCAPRPFQESHNFSMKGNISEMSIRELNPSEVALFRSIRLEALSSDPDAFGETLQRASSLSDSAWSERLANEIVPQRKTVFVIENQSEPIAMCFLGLRDDDSTTGYMGGVFVSLAFRRCGYGRSLLDATERWIQKHGGYRVRVKVAAPNNDAIDFYKSCGYVLTGRMDTLREGSDIPVYEIEKQLAL